MLNWWNHTVNLALHSFCEGNPFVRAAVWHCEAQLTAHRVYPPGRPVVSSRIGCVSLRSYWGMDHTASRHSHPFINTLLMHARGSILPAEQQEMGAMLENGGDLQHAPTGRGENLRLGTSARFLLRVVLSLSEVRLSRARWGFWPVQCRVHLNLKASL